MSIAVELREAALGNGRTKRGIELFRSRREERYAVEERGGIQSEKRETREKVRELTC